MELDEPMNDSEKAQKRLAGRGLSREVLDEIRDDLDDLNDEDGEDDEDDNTARRKGIKEISDELLELQDCTDGDKIRATVTDIWQQSDGQYVVEAEWGIDADPYTHDERFDREMGWNPETCRFDRLMEDIGVSPGNLEEAVEHGMDITIDISGDEPEFDVPEPGTINQSRIERVTSGLESVIMAPLTGLVTGVATIYAIGVSVSYNRRLKKYRALPPSDKRHMDPPQQSWIDGLGLVILLFWLCLLAVIWAPEIVAELLSLVGF